ncbi:hypothetical protein [Gallaecimonas pentaromativorans]|uniref:hypothetical protein n=1 Tax=Gallaecimonas pentaromativorans TaxID=584787 RepID=UPI00067EDE82|nr:hypothetical protein [Gallaecimonas pentaromativorans]
MALTIEILMVLFMIISVIYSIFVWARRANVKDENKLASPFFRFNSIESLKAHVKAEHLKMAVFLFVLRNAIFLCVIFISIVEYLFKL